MSYKIVERYGYFWVFDDKDVLYFKTDCQEDAQEWIDKTINNGWPDLLAASMAGH